MVEPELAYQSNTTEPGFTVEPGNDAIEPEIDEQSRPDILIIHHQMLSNSLKKLFLNKSFMTHQTILRQVFPFEI